MRNIFRATIPAQLIADIYKYHGWTRQEGESATKRIVAEFEVTTDHKRGQYVARRKAAK